jgi:hypothetical protein
MLDPIPTFSTIIQYLVSTYPSLSHISLIEARFAGHLDDPEASALGDSIHSNDFARIILNKQREVTDGKLKTRLLVGGGYSTEPSHAADTARNGDLAVFGRAFIANVSGETPLSHAPTLHDLSLICLSVLT